MRSSGILLHITSLPSPYGVGDLGPSAYAMVDFLSKAGQKHWQVLPINPTDGINGHSPYSCFSAFAGNPLLISPQQMVNDGFLTPSDLKNTPHFDKRYVDFPNVLIYKNKLFQTAYDRWMKKKDLRFIQFCDAEKNWVHDYAIFAVAKDIFKGQVWNQWPRGLRSRNADAVKKFIRVNGAAINRVKFIQFLFYKQWFEFKKYANQHKVKIIGDIPIYVNYDSVDVWCNPQFFKLNDQGQLKFISGCPPDYFSKTGQRWGNPVYDWAKLKKDKYRWWAARVEHNLNLFDILRIDHFRGFVSFWQIPAHEKLAVFGRWVKGPGEYFFSTLTKKFKHLPLIAEDLGEITQDVIDVMNKFNFAGMRVLLFAFGGDIRTNPHVPANYKTNCVAYTGTHDNNTIRGWYNTEAKPNEKVNIPLVLKKVVGVKELPWAMIQAVLESKADKVIIPLVDVLGLDQRARMNTPATKINNWKWRFEQKALTARLLTKLRSLTKQSGRV